MFGRLAFTMVVLVLSLQTAFAQLVTLNGIVTDKQKTPIGGASIIAVPDEPRYWTASELEPLSRAQTNGSGKFSIEVPTTGPVALVAWGPFHRMTKYPVNPETAKAVTIGMALEPGITVTGTVKDRATQKPVTGARVGPLVAGPDMLDERAMRVVPQWATVDSNGAFSFAGVAPDIEHQFTVQADGYMTINAELSVGTTTIDLPMDKGGSSVSGEVYQKGAGPGAFADTVVRANGNGFDVVRRTDSAGRFSFDGLPGGTFSVEPILSDDNRAAQVEVVELPDENGTSISLEVSAGYYIRGIAFDVETSAPANQVPISLDDRWATSSADGSFTLGPFYDRKQFALTVPESGGWRLEDVVAINEYNTTDGFTDVNNVTVWVRKQRLLEIQSGNYEATTQPVTITVLPADGMAIRVQATTSTVEVPVFQAGRYAVYGVSGGLASGLEPATVADQKSVPVHLEFKTAATASGMVTLVNTEETTRVRGFTVSMHTAPAGSQGSQMFSGTSPREDGSFLFPLMPSGSYILSVANESDTKTTTHPVTLSPGINTLPEIRWEAGNRIAGEVVNPQGEPVPFAQVTLLPQNEPALRLEADEKGLFRAHDLETNKLTGIVAEAAAFATYREQDVPLPADDKVLVMQPLGRLVIIVEAAPSTAWNVHIVRMSPWSVGAYAEQLVGHSIFTREVVGGETLETGIGEEGKFRAVAIEKSSGALMVSEAFDWAGERASGETIYLRSSATGTMSGSVGEGQSPAEVTLINTAIPESAGRDKGEFHATATNGQYKASGLPAGNYLVIGAGEASSSYALNVDLPTGESVTADLLAVSMATLSGVVEIAGEPLTGAAVRLVSETDSSYETRTATTGVNGRFAFEGLTPDSYSVEAEYKSEDEEMKTATSVAVKAGEHPAQVTLDLTPPQPVLFRMEPGVELPDNIDITLMNRQSRQLITAIRTNDGLEADAAPGQYEVWAGDAVVGVAEVGEDGTGVVRPQQ